MKNKKSVLHLCSYYTGNKLYSYLFNNLEKELSKQLVYVPIRNEQEDNSNYFYSTTTSIYYDLFLKKYHKVFYGAKIKAQRERLNALLIKNSLSVKDFDVVHAHTLFSDGGTAYLMNKEHGTPYVVSVRNTDINTFYKYALHYREFSHKVLMNAKQIVFISYAYKDILFDILPKRVVDKIKDRCVVIPNGIDDIYFQKNAMLKKSININKLRLFTSASLDSNKNIITILKLVKFLSDKGIDVNYRVAGKGAGISDLQDYVLNNQLGDFVTFVGYLTPEALIQELDNSDIFILLSFKETFGISYIEALARGKPIIFTKGQGVDGYFSEGSVGYGVEPTDIEAIFNAINLILNNYDDIVVECLRESINFKWPNISKKHIDIYTS
jgi:glycosyltransferase involved in cell wall biosynthesis